MFHGHNNIFGLPCPTIGDFAGYVVCEGSRKEDSREIITRDVERRKLSRESVVPWMRLRL